MDVIPENIIIGKHVLPSNFYKCGHIVGFIDCIQSDTIFTTLTIIYSEC